MAAITRTSFSTGDVPSTSEWNNQFDTVYNRVNGWDDGTIDLDALSISVGGTSVIDSSRNLENVTIETTALSKTESGITASTTQTQGQGALTSFVNEISTCANNNDTVTLPSAAAGLEVTVINNGANILQIFPASGDNLGNGSNTATSIASGDKCVFVAYDSTNWILKNNVIQRTISIGDWNMDSDQSINVAHGLSTRFKDIVSVDVIIRNDADDTYYKLERLNFSSGNMDGGVADIDSTNIEIGRFLGGTFDGTDFDSTSYSRGIIDIKYSI